MKPWCAFEESPARPQAAEAFSRQAAYVLGIISDRSWYQMWDVETDLDLFNRAAAEMALPAGTYVVLLNSANASLRKKMESVGGPIFTN